MLFYQSNSVILQNHFCLTVNWSVILPKHFCYLTFLLSYIVNLHFCYFTFLLSQISVILHVCYLTTAFRPQLKCYLTQASAYLSVTVIVIAIIVTVIIFVKSQIFWSKGSGEILWGERECSSKFYDIFGWKINLHSSLKLRGLAGKSQTLKRIRNTFFVEMKI